MTRFAFAVVVVCGISTIAEADSTLITFKSEAGRFTAELPGKPVATTENVGDGIIFYKWNLRANGLTYMLQYVDLPETPKFRKDPHGGLKAFRTGARKGQEIFDDREISLNSVPGRDYRASVGGLHIRERCYLDGMRLYRVILVGSKNDMTSAEAERYFDSFKFTN